MATTTPPSVTELPDAPSRTDRSTFRSRADAFVAALPTFGTELIALGTNVYNNAIDAYNSAVSALSYKTDAEAAKDIAIAASNFLGAWSGLTGSASIGDGVSHDSAIWLAIDTISDITTSEPSLTNTDWQIVSDQLGEIINTLGTLTGGTDDIDCAAGGVVTATISTATQTFTVSNVPSGRAYGFILYLTNGGSQTINWFSGTQWAGGIAPSLTESGLDRLIFDTKDGGTTWTATATLDIKASS